MLNETLVHMIRALQSALECSLNFDENKNMLKVVNTQTLIGKKQRCWQLLLLLFWDALSGSAAGSPVVVETSILGLIKSSDWIAILVVICRGEDAV